MRLEAELASSTARLRASEKQVEHLEAQIRIGAAVAAACVLLGSAALLALGRERR